MENTFGTDGCWRQTEQPCDVIELFLSDALVFLAVSSAGGRATQPCDGRFGNIEKNSRQAAIVGRCESWKPRLIVANFPGWTPAVSELALELVRRQRAGGREILIRYPLCTSMPLSLGHVKAASTWFQELWTVGLLTPLQGRHDFDSRMKCHTPTPTLKI